MARPIPVPIRQTRLRLGKPGCGTRQIVASLGLAHHHLGRLDEARRDCARALACRANDPVDEATQDVAIAALMTIRGQNVDQA